MSRIGKAIIEVPAGITVSQKDNVVTVKDYKRRIISGAYGGISFSQEDGVLTFTRPSDSKEHKALHGLYRALVNNMIVGTSTGFTKQLELVGVGYRASHNGQRLELALGFSHAIVLELPKEVTLDTLTEKGKNPIITLSSYDNQLLGMNCCLQRSDLSENLSHIKEKV